MTPERKQELKDSLEHIGSESDVIETLWQIGEVLKEVIDELP